MMYWIKKSIRDVLPVPVLLAYHRGLSLFAAALFVFPSRKLLVIGVTGTKGKTTTAFYLSRMFIGAGYRVGLATTAVIRVADHEWLNDAKMTMYGRFGLQRLLRDMVRAECTVAIIESSSEGLAMWRHAGIAYDTAVFTNLTPEHLEAHGSFAAYQAAKERLFAVLGAGSQRKKMLDGKQIPSRSVVNADDVHAAAFAAYPADEHWSYGTTASSSSHHIHIQNIHATTEGVTWSVPEGTLTVPHPGERSAVNATAAYTAARAHGITHTTIAHALAHMETVPGRLEEVLCGQPFRVIVDYAHEPASMEYILQTVTAWQPTRILHVFGSTGGGRDHARRPILGGLSAQYADRVYVTTDDPYDDDPAGIIAEVVAGAVAQGAKEGENLFAIVDRRTAITQAIADARPGDVVLITGKGSEQKLVGKGGVAVSWDDRVVVRDILMARATV